MNRRDTYIFTHYTEIAEAITRDVRSQQAEIAGYILHGLVKELRRAVQRISPSKQAPSRAKV